MSLSLFSLPPHFVPPSFCWPTDLQLLISKGSSIDVDEGKLIADLAEVDKDAANQYLEYVVVGKRSATPELQEALLAHLLDQAAEVVNDDGIKYHLEELGE